MADVRLALSPVRSIAESEVGASAQRPQLPQERSVEVAELANDRVQDSVSAHSSEDGVLHEVPFVEIANCKVGESLMNAKIVPVSSMEELEINPMSSMEELEINPIDPVRQAKGKDPVPMRDETEQQIANHNLVAQLMIQDQRPRKEIRNGSRSSEEMDDFSGWSRGNGRGFFCRGETDGREDLYHPAPSTTKLWDDWFNERFPAPGEITEIVPHAEDDDGLAKPRSSKSPWSNYEKTGQIDLDPVCPPKVGLDDQILSVIAFELLEAERDVTSCLDQTAALHLSMEKELDAITGCALNQGHDAKKNPGYLLKTQPQLADIGRRMYRAQDRIANIRRFLRDAGQGKCRCWWCRLVDILSDVKFKLVASSTWRRQNSYSS